MCGWTSLYFAAADCGAMSSGQEVICKVQTRKRYSKKIRDAAMRPAALGENYERASNMLGFAESTLRNWLNQENCKRSGMSGEVLEMDGVWTQGADGKVELKVARDERGVALSSAGSWEDALVAERDMGASARLGISSATAIER